jgi:hypothetical protein
LAQAAAPTVLTKSTEGTVSVNKDEKPVKHAHTQALPPVPAPPFCSRRSSS